MRGLLRAAVLLAPALATAAPASSEDGHYTSASTLVHLELPYAESRHPIETTFDVEVLSSLTPCGYGNVTINGQDLVQDANGIGSGSITTREDNMVVAHWQFTCVEAETVQQRQQLVFEVDFVDGKSVAETKFIVHFRQVSPVAVSFVEGVNALSDDPRSGPASRIVTDSEWRSVLADELAELRYMELQLTELRDAIAQKKRLLAHAYAARRKEVKLSDCDNLKCLASSVFTSVKDMALGIYHEITAHPGHPPFSSPHHGNGTHGNHTWPPHHKPVFCHCPPPPRLPHHGRPGKGPDRHGPSKEDQLGLAHPGPGLLSIGQDDRQGGEKVLQPPFQPMSQEHPFQITSEHPDQPPPPPPPPPPGKEAPGHGNPPHHPPPFNLGKFFEHITPIQIVGLLGVCSLVIFIIIHGCCLARVKVIKARLRQRREERRRECISRRQRCREQRAARRAALRAHLKAKFSALLQRLKDSLSGRDVEEEEKEAVMRRIHGDDSDSDTMSTTMEQLRTVVGVVGDLVAAEEGRAHSHANRELLQHAMRAPPSPRESFPDDISIDESLPAYDEASDESSRVADGLRYTPGSTMYTPSDTSVAGSLDDVLGRKD